MYDQLISKLGPEYKILADIPIATIKREDETIGTVIDAFRQHQITFVPGGGGTFGNINLPEFE
jgi:PHP family Zn ribbon phosphoesterase